MAEATRTVRSGFLRSAERFPERPALEVAGEVWSYARLAEQAARIAARVRELTPADGGPALTAVLGARSATAFAGVLAALWNGHGYVPLNPSFPVERTRAMLARSGARAVIVDAGAREQLAPILAGLETPVAVVDPERDVLPAPCALAPASPEAIAYLLFTSGSTGVPKGVMVAHRNVTRFVDVMVERYGVRESDRFSQTFDLTFDLSAFDMFVAWERGACVCVPSQQQKMLPGRYIRDAALTIWFSVPSTGALMSRLRLLKPGSYPTLRWSLFCGEALPAEIVSAWSAAAPGSVIENLYGPTELTIACTLYRWDAARSLDECEQGVVPIGEPYPGMKVLVADASLAEVAPGETGELLMTGPQLSLGYWQDPERTRAAFVRPPGRDEIFYRTGDRVRRPRTAGAPLVYLGRMDHQIKIQGYRVELGEIEAALRDEAKVELAVALGWPATPSGADGVVAFVAGELEDPAAVLTRLKQRLPAYMVPSAIRSVASFPLNANGKIDRKALAATLAAGSDS